MAEGTLDGDAIVCAWHQSRFRIEDGAIERGPATMPLPAYDCRVRGDDVEVRART
jgi:nitrite reductase/ring-hydroxylating ferredoxin subunit